MKPTFKIERKDGIFNIITTGCKSLLDIRYPIGSIYAHKTDPTSPAQKYGGEWEQIKDRFLLGAGDNYSAGSTGGEACHTLTQDEMPSHSHSIQTFPNAGSSTRFYQISREYGSGVNESINWTGGVANNTGGSQPHNNMPPYKAYYMWIRYA